MSSPIDTPPNDTDVQGENATISASIQRAFRAAYMGDIYSLRKEIDSGFPIDRQDGRTGMSLLHVAVGRDDLDMAKFLIERGAGFFVDGKGRWPTTVAAVCEVSEEMCDYIVEAEAKAVGF